MIQCFVSPATAENRRVIVMQKMALKMNPCNCVNLLLERKEEKMKARKAGRKNKKEK
jgi:hypothetical protein